MNMKKSCKLCNRSFPNGQSLGGHMRSHLVYHPLPLTLVDSSPTSSSSSTLGDTNSSNSNNEPVSSISDTSTEEEVLALCLVMLSRDHWRTHAPEEEDSRIKANHQCPACERVFATGQALGGHKRAHFNADKKKKKKKEEEEEGELMEKSGEGKSSWRLIDLNLPPLDPASPLATSSVSVCHP